jgi:hypothetical protein
MQYKENAVKKLKQENDSMPDRGEIIIYQTEDGLTKIDVSMQDETVRRHIVGGVNSTLL